MMSNHMKEMYSTGVSQKDKDLEYLREIIKVLISLAHDPSRAALTGLTAHRIRNPKLVLWKYSAFSKALVCICFIGLKF